MKMTIDELSGNVEMCRRNDSGNFILTIKDDTSRIPVVEVTLTPGQFADLLSSRVTGDSVPMRFWRTEKHGKQRTTKMAEEVLTIAPAGDFTKELQIAATKLQAENPEWEVEVPRTWNQHRARYCKTTEDGKPTYIYQILMVRYI